ncbi:MAG: hypothetical protein HY000_01155 [Planctomycetes bacterium]|nr:hypothetical protein [Planctomycetota bacterium]
MQSIGWTLAVAIVTLALAAGGFKLSQIARAQVQQQERFRVSLASVELSPLPVWIHGDLLGEVKFLSGLPDTVNTLEPNLAERLRSAFALHPWVCEVLEVRITQPATIRVQLAYREPVAVVRTARSLEPVDREGVLLPAAGFPNPEVYLTVSGVRSTPTGPAGTRWDDSAVGAAARVAEAVTPHHRTLGLTTLDVSRYRPNAAAASQIYLLTEQGTRVKWGRPDPDYPGEVSTEDKLDRLRQYVADHGSLDSPAGPYDIDVTHWQEVSIRPRQGTGPK